MEIKCPNCLDLITEPRDACLLEVAAATLINRGHALEAVLAMMQEVEADELWNLFGGPMVDYLEDEYLGAPAKEDECDSTTFG